jgi:hypothetical protein
MSNRDEPAFPIVKTDWPSSNYHKTFSEGGLTKREYFAGLAMQGLCADPKTYSDSEWDIARVSVTIADALLAELERAE